MIRKSFKKERSSLTYESASTELNKFGIKTVVPNSKDQRQISNIIIRIINNKSNHKDKEKIINIIRKLERQKTEAIILGCTDLQLLISQKDSPIPLLDTTKILENATFEKLVKKTSVQITT